MGAAAPLRVRKEYIFLEISAPHYSEDGDCIDRRCNW
jgi:hypothetical protein